MASIFRRPLVNIAHHEILKSMIFRKYIPLSPTTGPTIHGSKVVNDKTFKLCCRYLSSHYKRPPLVFTDIQDEEMARALVLQLKPEGRSLVLAEIGKMIEHEKQIDKTKTDTLDGEQLKNLFFFNALPFVGFGFLDNFIMIVAGEYIDATLGATLAISTMAAAAMGNLISDVAGIGLSGYVEVLVGKLGVTHPLLNPAQACTWQVRWTQMMGRTIGIIIGCLIGMFPLLFYKDSDDKKKDDKDENFKAAAETN